VASTASSTTGMTDCLNLTGILGGPAIHVGLVLAPRELDVGRRVPVPRRFVSPMKEKVGWGREPEWRQYYSATLEVLTRFVLTDCSDAIKPCSFGPHSRSLSTSFFHGSSHTPAR